MTMRTCLICGKEFKPRPAQIRNGAGKYCSHKCSDIARVGQKHKPETIEKIRLANKGKKFSEESKRKISESKKGTQAKENNPNWKGGKRTVKCSNCGKTLEIRRYKFKTQKYFYCNYECKAIHQSNSGLFSGENNPFYGRTGKDAPGWKGGISFEPYCPKFNYHFKERVRKFWNRKCGICGKTEKENNSLLQVHHVNYEKMVCCDNTPPLFIPLCRSCHSKTNHNREGWEHNLTTYIMIYFNGESYLPNNESDENGQNREPQTKKSI